MTDASVRVERVGRAALMKIVQASIPKALRRFVRFTRVTGNQDRLCSVCVGGALPFHPPGRMLTPTPTWTGPPKSAGFPVPLSAPFVSTVSPGGNICLISYVANPLSRSRNYQADGDGCEPDASVVQRLKGVTVCTVGSEPWRGSLSDRVLKPLRLFSFHRVTGTLKRDRRCSVSLDRTTVSPAREKCRPPPAWTGTDIDV